MMSKKILLVEDDEMLQFIMSRYLQQSDYEVLVANDGVEGVKIASNETPDLILMDMFVTQLEWVASNQAA